MKKIITGLLLLSALLLAPARAYADMGAPMQGVKILIMKEGILSKRGVEIPYGAEATMDFYGDDYDLEVLGADKFSVYLYYNSEYEEVELTWDDIQIIQPENENVDDAKAVALGGTVLYELPTLVSKVAYNVPAETKFDVVCEDSYSQFTYVISENDKDVKGWVLSKGDPLYEDENRPTIMFDADIEYKAFAPIPLLDENGKALNKTIKAGDMFKVTGFYKKYVKYMPRFMKCEYNGETFYCKDDEFLAKKIDLEPDEDVALYVFDASKMNTFDKDYNPVKLDMQTITVIEPDAGCTSYNYCTYAACFTYNGETYYLKAENGDAYENAEAYHLKQGFVNNSCIIRKKFETPVKYYSDETLLNELGEIAADTEFDIADCKSDWEEESLAYAIDYGYIDKAYTATEIGEVIATPVGDGSSSTFVGDGSSDNNTSGDEADASTVIGDGSSEISSEISDTSVGDGSSDNSDTKSAASIEKAMEDLQKSYRKTITIAIAIAAVSALIAIIGIVLLIKKSKKKD